MASPSRANLAGRNLLARCEALLRQLLRRRRRRLGISVGELMRGAAGYDGCMLRAPMPSLAATAFLLVSMYWCGCRHPAALFMVPLHPPTGLVRWLAGFTVQDQVDRGQLLLARLAEEEQRIFDFAQRLVAKMAAMGTSRCSGILLLPELLKIAE